MSYSSNDSFSDSSDCSPSSYQCSRTRGYLLSNSHAINSSGEFSHNLRKETDYDNSKSPVENCRSLAEAGDPFYQYELGNYYKNKLGGCIKKDLEEAFKWYEKSADKNYVPAQYALGKLWESGIEGFISSSIEKAIGLYELAIDGFFSSFVYNGSIPKLAYKIKNRLKQLADKDKDPNPKAAYVLGKLYIKGEIFGEDFNLANDYFSRAFQLGYIDLVEKLSENASPETCFFLGFAYERDNDWLKKNLNEAIKWYKLTIIRNGMKLKEVEARLIFLADDKNEPEVRSEAQCVLGKLYFEGKYVKKDLRLARYYLTEAANAGHIEAIELLSALFTEETEAANANHIEAIEPLSALLTEETELQFPFSDTDANGFLSENSDTVPNDEPAFSSGDHETLDTPVDDPEDTDNPIELIARFLSGNTNIPSFNLFPVENKDIKRESKGGNVSPQILEQNSRNDEINSYNEENPQPQKLNLTKNDIETCLLLEAKEKQNIKRSRAIIYSDPRKHSFYQKVSTGLLGIFTRYIGESGGLDCADLTLITTTGEVIELAGMFAPLPIISAITRVINIASVHIERQRSLNEAKLIAESFPSKDYNKLSRKVARKLTLAYAKQLEELKDPAEECKSANVAEKLVSSVEKAILQADTKTSVAIVAQFAVEQMKTVIRERKLGDDNPVEALLQAVILKQSRVNTGLDTIIENLAMKPLSTIDESKQWTPRDFYQKPGLKYYNKESGGIEYYKTQISNTDSYGYRCVTANQLQQYPDRELAGLSTIPLEIRKAVIKTKSINSDFSDYDSEASMSATSDREKLAVTKSSTSFNHLSFLGKGYPLFQDPNQNEIKDLKKEVSFLKSEMHRLKETDRLKTEEISLLKTEIHRLNTKISRLEEGSGVTQSNKENEDYRTIEEFGFDLHDVSGDGNCFYYSLADQLLEMRSSIVQDWTLATFNQTISTPFHQWLRNQSGLGTEDRQWGTDADMHALARRFNIVFAVVSTKRARVRDVEDNIGNEIYSDGFHCLYIDSEGNDARTIPGQLFAADDRPIVRLAHTGTHFLSVHKHDALPSGALTEPFQIANQSASSSSASSNCQLPLSANQSAMFASSSSTSSSTLPANQSQFSSTSSSSSSSTSSTNPNFTG